jgi:Cft2 family RNA processing exonuclease
VPQMMPLTYQQLGEQSGFGTMHYLKWNNGKINIVIDSGIRFVRQSDGTTKVLPAGNYLEGEYVHFLIITHAHADHSGSVARFTSLHPETIVITTAKVMDALEIMLWDNVINSQREFNRLAKEQEGLIYDPVVDANELANFLDEDNPNIVIIEDDELITDKETGVKIQCHYSGHDDGAASYGITFPDERPVLFTGDICRHDLDLTKGVMVPSSSLFEKFVSSPHLIFITEGTNGDRKMHKSYSQVKSELIASMHEIKAREGVALVAAFGRGRSNNTAMALIRAGFSVHLDGLPSKLAPLEIPNFRELIASKKLLLFDREGETREEMDKHRYRADMGEDCCGVGFAPTISSSATLEMGRSVGHATNILPGPKNGLFSVGHIFDNTPMQRLMGIQKGRTIKLYNNREAQKIDVRADVFHLPLSAHDFQEDLVERNALLGPRYTIIHHCTPLGYYGLRDAIRARMTISPRIYWGKHLNKIEFPATT